MLGAMLFIGDNIPRHAARGLMWLTLAKDSAHTTDQARIGKSRCVHPVMPVIGEERKTCALIERFSIRPTAPSAKKL